MRCGEQRFEAAWEAGGLLEILGVFNDLMLSPTTNEVIAEMLREKIRPPWWIQTAAKALCPKDHPFGSKRPCLDTNYFETYDSPRAAGRSPQQPIVTSPSRGS